MTTTDASNVRVAISGAVYVAPIGSLAPTSASSPLDPVWKSLGYISEDGVKEEHDMESDEIKGWQNSTVVRSTVTKYGIAYTLSAMELNKDVVEAFYGDDYLVDVMVDQDIYSPTYTPTYGVMTAAASSIGIIGGRIQSKRAIVIDTIDGNVTTRRFAPNVQVTTDGEVEIVASNAMMYPMRFDCNPDSSISGSVKAFYNTVLS